MSELPHCLQGALLFNCVLALVISSLLHRSMPPHIRVENALTAFIILDLGKMWADAKATKKGLRRGAFWLAAATMQNLQDLAGSGCFVTYIYIFVSISLSLITLLFPIFPVIYLVIYLQMSVTSDFPTIIAIMMIMSKFGMQHPCPMPRLSWFL